MRLIVASSFHLQFWTNAILLNWVMYFIFATQKPKTDQAFLVLATFDITNVPHEMFCKLTPWPNTKKCFSLLMMPSSASVTRQIPTFKYNLQDSESEITQ